MSIHSIKFRLSLRCALIFLTLFCVSLGWLHSRANTQKIAVEEITKSGGKIKYCWENYDYGTWFQIDTGPTVPLFLRQIFGDDYFFDVIYADLSDVTEANLNETLRAAGTIKCLRFLDLQYQTLNDGTLSHISSLTLLQKLDLSNSNIKNSELKYIAELNNLVELSLESNAVSVDGLRHGKIGDKSRLRMLALSDTEVTNEVFELIRGIQNLELLTVLDTRVTTDRVEEFEANFPCVSVVAE